MKTIINITGQPIVLERDEEAHEETILGPHEEVDVEDEKAEAYLQISNIIEKPTDPQLDE